MGNIPSKPPAPKCPDGSTYCPDYAAALIADHKFQYKHTNYYINPQDEPELYKQRYGRYFDPATPLTEEDVGRYVPTYLPPPERLVKRTRVGRGKRGDPIGSQEDQARRNGSAKGAPITGSVVVLPILDRASGVNVVASRMESSALADATGVVSSSDEEVRVGRYTPGFWGPQVVRRDAGMAYIGAVGAQGMAGQQRMAAAESDTVLIGVQVREQAIVWFPIFVYLLVMAWVIALLERKWSRAVAMEEMMERIDRLEPAWIEVTAEWEEEV